ncbi:DUF5060 domain-containing protein [Adhaeretor mobilis]|uniref:DUF5060 domain-containing protein n=1 Tax=Adhaeretor mobilis TaxID=1930276 RepID=A0A517MXV9_9BACT|nr:DUF5060 domain-containing protein [Adhaeretor mobilis]QDS99709.1 hypothetical protein HG15A2_30370 [Adhaeretor mobilis]
MKELTVRTTRLRVYFALITVGTTLPALPPVAAADTQEVQQESAGYIEVEAENFFNQSNTDKRSWRLTTPEETPKASADGDPNHAAGASGKAYLEVLPDTRRNHGHKLIHGENFTEKPGEMAVLEYRVNFQTPGRYYVWARGYSTGGEDNGIHVGLDGKWPESGKRMQWCVGKNRWHWESRQRTAKQHCGVPHQIYLEIDKPGAHTVQFSMREDGFEFDKWLLTTDRDFKPKGYEAAYKATSKKAATKPKSPLPPLVLPRQSDGNGEVTVEGEMLPWHRVSVTLDGPYAHERDNKPNPFIDYRMTVYFTRDLQSPDEKQLSYAVPGYFATDGNAGETSAESGTKWRADFRPDMPGKWHYRVEFAQGRQIAMSTTRPDDTNALRALHCLTGKNLTGSFVVLEPTGKQVGFTEMGRLNYVGKRYLQFADTGRPFLKVGADSPETLLAYTDFDGTTAHKKNVPLKTWQPHIQDWRAGDPTWQQGKGKGLIGAMNYLAEQGANSISFIPYNVGGDGNNVWPMIAADDKLHYDCSKLDQWQRVFDHAQTQGVFLHFKLQETENDDQNTGRGGKTGEVVAALDGGELGVERKLYFRELIARFGYQLALNWNLGEENTQSPEVQRQMANYLREVDPFDHLIVIHTYPQQQEKVYRPLLGEKSVLTGVSLQNHWNQSHQRTQQWIAESAAAGKIWVACNDEQGPAGMGVPPDPGYKTKAGEVSDGYATDGKSRKYDLHDIRKHTLWGTLMAGGAGVEYYFGYKLPENDLGCEDFRSRQRSWQYGRIARSFFERDDLPLEAMSCRDDLVGNPKHDNSRYCLAKPGEVYLVYLPTGGEAKLDLSEEDGQYEISWFDPRNGGDMATGSVTQIAGGKEVGLGLPPNEPQQDWLAVVRKQK